MPLWSFEGGRNPLDLKTIERRSLSEHPGARLKSGSGPRRWHRTHKVSAVIAAGVHLFPFRTEKLSPPAPMVLGGQPPGRVGRRRISSRAARAALFLSPNSQAGLPGVGLRPVRVVERPGAACIGTGEVFLERVRSYFVGHEVVRCVLLCLGAVELLDGVASTGHQEPRIPRRSSR